jgi:geranylgeranyl reductase
MKVWKATCLSLKIEIQQILIMHNEKVDVLIVGAGPAGLSCAKALGDSNLSVLVLEKNKIVGPKVCAGGITGLAQGKELPAGKAVRFHNQQLFVNDRQSLLRLEQPISMIDRLALGDLQAGELKQFDNVRVRTGKRVVKLTREHVVTRDGGRISFRYLVGADGATSIVRRYLGLTTRFYAGIQYILGTVHDRCCWFVRPRRLRTGYAWIFPHTNFTSAGVYFNPKLVTFSKARKCLVSILDKHNLDYSDARFESAPINCMYCGIKFGNILLAGEAAGLVSAASGEGIPYALTSGEDIGTHILNPWHDFDKTRCLLRYKRRQEMILKAMDSLSPLLQEMMFTLFMKLMMNERVRSHIEGAA